MLDSNLVHRPSRLNVIHVGQTGDSPLASMGLEHDFLLVALAEHAPADYARFIRSSAALHVHDDVLRYIGDTLNWIPTVNPATGKSGFGLNYHGPTAILSNGAPLAAKIFEEWVRLFELGPAHLELTGPWTTIEGE